MTGGHHARCARVHRLSKYGIMGGGYGTETLEDEDAQDCAEDRDEGRETCCVVAAVP